MTFSLMAHSVFSYIIPFFLHFPPFSFTFFGERTLWVDLDGDKDQENLIRSKSQRSRLSEVDRGRKERQATKLEDKVSLGTCNCLQY